MSGHSRENAYIVNPQEILTLHEILNGNHTVFSLYNQLNEKKLQ